ncbi:MAG: adenylate/guanylate cyclase domain-containing protein [candidate division WOR-3 bacterium]
MSIKCPKCSFENPDGFVFCGKCGSRLIEEKKGERKRVSVMFVDVAGFTSLSEKRDAEDVVKILNIFFTEVKKIVEYYDGKIDKYIGDACLCFFGVKGGYENHAEKAIRAALEILNFVKNLKKEYGIGVHVGINSGEILLTGIGLSETLDYTVIGDTVNLAQRIESLSGIDEILVSETTKNLAGDIFLFESLGAQKVKGKKEKIKIFKVLGLSEELKESRRFFFVGRKEIIDKILKEINENKKIKVFVIYGPPGIGKTSLLNKIKDLIEREYKVYSFRASPFGGEFNIFSSEFKKSFDFKKEEDYFNFIDYIEKKKKTIFILDDMQWADFLSYEFIKFIIERIKIPLTLIIATRNKDVILRRLKGVDLDFIELKGFDYEEFKEFINKLNISLPVHYQEEIFEKTKGNPLFINEILISKGKKIPDRIDLVLMSEVENLDESLKEILKKVSVLGPSFEEKALSLIDIESKDLEKLVEKAYLFKEENKYYFKTPLFQETIYNTLLKEERRDIHRKIWKNSKDKENIFSIYHAFRGELFDDVIKFGEKMLNILYERGSISDLKLITDFLIESYKEKNLEVSKNCIYKRIYSLLHLGFLEEAKILIENLSKEDINYYDFLSLYFSFKGEKEKSLYILKKGISLLGDKGKKLFLSLADVLLDMGEFKEGFLILEKIKDEVSFFEKRDRLKFMNLYQTALENTGKYKKSLEICYKLYKEKENLSLSELAALESSIALNNLILGNLEDAEIWFEKSIEKYNFLREYKSLYPVLVEYSYLLYTKGEFEKALKNLKKARYLAESMRDKEYLAKIDAYEGIVFLSLGKIKKAEKSFENSKIFLDSEELFKGVNLTVIHNYATLLLYKRKFEDSITYFKKLIELSRKEKDKYGENFNLYSLSLSYFLLGDIDNSIKYIEEPLFYSKKEKLKVFYFRVLSLLFKIKVIKKENKTEILRKMEEIIENTKRRDLLLLYNFYKLWLNKIDFKKIKSELRNLKKELKFNIYLIEKYSLDVLKKFI